MGSKLHVPLDPGVVSDCNGHNEYQLVPTPIFGLLSSDGPTHPCPWQRKFQPSRIEHNIDDRIVNRDLLVVPVAFVSDSSPEMMGDGVHDELVGSARSALLGDDAACAVVVVEVGVGEMDDGDIRGDCNTVLGLRGNRSVHPGSNSAHGGKLGVADRSIPIDLVVGDDEGLEGLQPLG